MKKTPVLSIICIVAVLSGITVSITACSSGGSGTITETYYPVEVTFNAPAAYTGTMVIPVDFTTEPTHTITIPNLAGHNVFLVKENVSDKTAYASMTGSVNSSSLDGVPLSLSVRSVSASDTSLSLSGGRSAISAVSGTSGGITRYDFVPARDSNAGEPLSARSISASSLADTPKVERDIASALNDTRTFWVPTTNDATAFTSLTAKLCASGEHCYIWVATGPDSADAVYNDSSTVDNDNQITTTQAGAMAAKFDKIYPLETGILGYEYGGALVPTSTDGGVDHDSKITILVYDIGYDYNINQTSGVLGYFWSKDMLTGTYSNKAEMFYLDSHFTDYSVGYIYSTLIHEFQHMINYNRKIVTGSNLNVPIWYNEMLSLMAEDMLDSDPAINIDDLAIPSASRTPLFNGEYDHTSAAGGNWLSGDQVLISYADAYAFGAYLARNYGGNDLVKAMEDSASVGIPSITYALNSLGSVTFDNAFRRYGEALVFSGNAVNGNNTFDKAVDNFKAFDIWDIKNQYYDNSDGLYYDWVHNDLSPVKGPTVWDLNQSNLPPYGIALQSNDAWQNCYGQLEITLNRPSNDKVELFLMVR